MFEVVGQLVICWTDGQKDEEGVGEWTDGWMGGWTQFPVLMRVFYSH